MSTATRKPDRRLDPLPDDLESPRAKLVYVTLSVVDSASLRDLHDVLDVPKLTLLSVLDTLTGRNLVERTDDGFVTVA